MRAYPPWNWRVWLSWKWGEVRHFFLRPWLLWYNRRHPYINDLLVKRGKITGKRVAFQIRYIKIDPVWTDPSIRPTVLTRAELRSLEDNGRTKTASS